MKLTSHKISLLQRYWQAANYLAAAQIYLKTNPLLKEPLRPEHIKPRLLGHWGTSPGLNFIYVHLNRLIRETGADMLLVCGPGHGAPAIVANVYLEGTYSQVYPQVTQDEKGMELLFRRFSTPGGIPSHVSAETPGSIHEGGELGYCLAHATGAAFDNPNLIVVCVVGDGEAETGPLEGSWKSIRFLNPERDGAVLPILHLNGYKIANPSVLARMDKSSLSALLEAYGYTVYIVSGHEPETMHVQFAEVLEKACAQITMNRELVRSGNASGNLRWPLIVLETPKGWTGPVQWKGVPIEGTAHAHQVPLTEVRENGGQLLLLEEWLRSYKPETLFDENGTLLAELSALVPLGNKRLGATPYANAGYLLQQLQLPDAKEYAVPVQHPGVKSLSSTNELGKYLRDIFKLNEAGNNFRLFCPDETASNKLQAVFETTERFATGYIEPTDEHLSVKGRVMEVLSEHLCQGWLEGYLLTGRHGLFACYEAFITIIDSMFNQYAKWIKSCREISWRQPVASLNYLLTSHTWRQDHNGYSHQGPGFIDTVANKKSQVIRIYLPPDANTLLCVAQHCLGTYNQVNLIVAGKQPELQWLGYDEAMEHCKRGASIWHWAGNAEHHEPDIILACAGDVPTLETVAAAVLLNEHLPAFRVRVVNIVNLMSLTPPESHSHGLDENMFREMFTEDKHVIFAFHGYVRIIHDLVHGRPEPERFHVRGFMEEGTTTTPFDMVVLNQISRYHLAMEAIRRGCTLREGEQVIQLFEQKLQEHHRYIREHLDDMPEIRNWKFSFSFA